MKRFLVFWVFVGLLCYSSINAVNAENTDVEGDNDDDGVTVETEEEEAPVVYQSPKVEPGRVHLAEHFDNNEQFEKKWVRSQAKKEGIDEDIAKYDGIWSLEEPQKQILRGDQGLVLKSKAKHAAIASRLNRPFVFADKPLVVQYEVTWQDGQECGGSYIKLLSSGKETTNLGEV